MSEMEVKKVEPQPFYKQGVRFECQKDCSRCCGGTPGYVWLDAEDVVRISRFMELPVPEFIAKYTKDVDGELSLRDIEEDNWNCIMLKEGRCSIYDVRPMQCRTFPFWYYNLSSKKRWDRMAQDCPGVGKGRMYSRVEVEKICSEDETIDSIK